MKTVDLCNVYKDEVTGSKGIATARIQYLYRGTQILLEREWSDNQTAPLEQWFDESRLERVEEELKAESLIEKSTVTGKFVIKQKDGEDLDVVEQIDEINRRIRVIESYLAIGKCKTER